jgi:hypothetical protein
MLKDPEVLNILRSAQAEEVAPHERLKEDKPKVKERETSMPKPEVTSPISGGQGTVNYDNMKSELSEDSSLENLAL